MFTDTYRTISDQVLAAKAGAYDAWKEQLRLADLFEEGKVEYAVVKVATQKAFDADKLYYDLCAQRNAEGAKS